jgi:SAM-dependent methyltransferase
MLGTALKKVRSAPRSATASISCGLHFFGGQRLWRVNGARGKTEAVPTQDDRQAGSVPTTWHYGLVAEWWAVFNHDGPEIEYFGRYVAAGQPALDAGCGTGRLLLPWLRAGYDVDGSDVSPDMITICRERARADGFDPTLLLQPLHQLSTPRRYQTIVACGVFGLGSTRRQDEEALRRFYEHLEPGGMLLLDSQVPYADHMRWGYWPRLQRQGHFPEPWPQFGASRQAPDGSVYEMRTRVRALDPLDQSVVLDMRMEKRRGGRLLAAEEHALSVRGFLRDELVMMLERAGFANVEVTGDYTADPPHPDHQFLVYAARR